MNPISTYLNEHLGTFLQDKDLNPDTISTVTKEVETRLTALLARWNDVEFRSTLLLVTLEEATFYMPLHLEVNGLVVLAIRNSDSLQDLHGTQQVLDDSEIRALTTQAIEYFAELDLEALAGEVTAPEQDPFGALSTQYPLAWEALRQLAMNTTRYASQSYEPLQAGAADLPDIEAQQLGFDISEELADIQNGKNSFLFRDSFKLISRHTDKLLYIIEYVLRAGKIVLTHNYYLSNGMVARRKPLLKPAQKQTDIYKKFNNKTGLVKRHQDSLRLLKKYVVPAPAERTTPAETPAE